MLLYYLPIKALQQQLVDKAANVVYDLSLTAECLAASRTLFCFSDLQKAALESAVCATVAQVVQ